MQMHENNVSSNRGTVILSYLGVSQPYLLTYRCDADWKSKETRCGATCVSVCVWLVEWIFKKHPPSSSKTFSLFYAYWIKFDLIFFLLWRYFIWIPIAPEFASPFLSSQSTYISLHTRHCRASSLIHRGRLSLWPLSCSAPGCWILVNIFRLYVNTNFPNFLKTWKENIKVEECQKHSTWWWAPWTPRWSFPLTWVYWEKGRI